jgi:hypothetical protein
MFTWTSSRADNRRAGNLRTDAVSGAPPLNRRIRTPSHPFSGHLACIKREGINELGNSYNHNLVSLVLLSTKTTVTRILRKGGLGENDRRRSESHESRKRERVATEDWEDEAVPSRKNEQRIERTSNLWERKAHMSTQFLRGRATCQRLFSHSKTKPMDEDLTAVDPRFHEKKLWLGGSMFKVFKIFFNIIPCHTIQLNF